jgi:hypothetical protein
VIETGLFFDCAAAPRGKCGAVVTVDPALEDEQAPRSTAPPTPPPSARKPRRPSRRFETAVERSFRRSCIRLRSLKSFEFTEVLREGYDEEGARRGLRSADDAFASKRRDFVVPEPELVKHVIGVLAEHRGRVFAHRAVMVPSHRHPDQLERTELGMHGV